MERRYAPGSSIFCDAFAKITTTTTKLNGITIRQAETHPFCSCPTAYFDKQLIHVLKELKCQL